MANNCLVTKLNGIVDNDSLKKLGVLGLKICNSSVVAQFPTSTKFDFCPVSGKESTLTILNQQAVITVQSPNVSVSNTVATLKNGGKLVVTSSTSDVYFDAEVDNKYDLMKLSCLYLPDTSDFAYCDKIEKIESLGMTGDISEIVSNCPQMYDFNLMTGNGVDYVDISGRWSDLIGNCERLTYLACAATTNIAVSSVEDAVAIRVQKGQTSSTGNGVRLKLASSKALTFNGSPIEYHANGYWLSWSNSGATINLTPIQ